MRIILFVFCLFLINLYAGEKTDLERKKQLERISEQIKELKKEKERYQKKAKIHQQRAASWQFNKDFSLESRREYFLAEKDLDKIHLIELKIKDCEREKEEL